LAYVHRVSGTLLPRLSHRTGHSSSNSHRGRFDSVPDSVEVVPSRSDPRRCVLYCEIRAAHATYSWAATPNKAVVRLTLGASSIPSKEIELALTTTIPIPPGTFVVVPTRALCFLVSVLISRGGLHA